MAQQNYLKAHDTNSRFYKSTNVLDLIKKSKLERLEEKKHRAIYVVITMLSLTVVASIIIL